MVTFTTGDEVSNTVKSLRATFFEGVTRPLEFRKQQLKQLYRLLEDNEDALTEAVYKDLRKGRNEFLIGEMNTPKEEILYMLKARHRWSSAAFTC
ncbi:hypothetical protein BZG36_04527 [Bifiguratus adelaidae]|uniref:Aldehyde dehydrogenase domain-containing protein n=1 Tax=Bifiguratus adelaidae TaxID=1938954 RepID=A0A261XXX4_9FUNG|nr:hypothetical protein BZG36_04527 [Bifiguratus adelaidae]